MQGSIGGNLNIQSLQDTARFDSKSQSLSASGTIGAGGGGNVSASQSNVSADYAAVGQQAGIRAGDNGFQLTVKGNTELIGGAITSSQAAIDAGKNSFATGTLSTSDIANKSQYSASAVTVSAGTGGGMAGAFKDSGDERSTTQSTISAANITITSGNEASQTALDRLDRGATNDVTAGQLAQGWDGQKLGRQGKLNAQIVADFGAQASKEIGTEFGKKVVALKTEAGKLAEGDPNRQALLDEAAKYDEGGAYRIAAHAVVGGLTGNVQGALGAGTAASLAPQLDKLQGNLQDGLAALGVSKDKTGDQQKSPAEALAKLLTGAIASAAGGAVGGPAGAAAGLNEDFNNRQLHPDQIALVKSQAKKLAGSQGLDEDGWEKRLTQQLLYQNDSAYATSFGNLSNDPLAEQILANLARDSGVSMDARGTAAYVDHTANTQHLNQTIGSYKLAGQTPSGGIEQADGSWLATKPGTVAVPSGYPRGQGARAQAHEAARHQGPGQAQVQGDHRQRPRPAGG